MFTRTKKLLSTTGLSFAMMALVACGGASTEEGSGEEQADSTVTEAEATSEAAEYTIDADNSSVQWTGTMMGMYSHEGTISITEGSLTVENGNVTGGSVTIDMASINPTDENFSEDKPKENLIGHLSSPDFFDIANHPTSTFTITSGSEGSVSGDLTIRGTTNSASASEVSVTEDGSTVNASGTITINRQDYNVSWASPGDAVLSDDIVLVIKLSGTK